MRQPMIVCWGVMLPLFLLLTGCSSVQGWMHKTTLEAEAGFAVAEQSQNPGGRPVGAIYDVLSSYGNNRQISTFYSGSGLARVFTGSNGDTPKSKIIINYNARTVTELNIESAKRESQPLDPFTYPSILSAQAAKNAGATCLGMGRLRGYPYHRWSKRKGMDEWEVWTDDIQCFPVYFRSIQNGQVTTWTVINSWIDESTASRPSFYTTYPDPVPPPQPPQLDNENTLPEPGPKRGHKPKPHKDAEHRAIKGITESPATPDRPAKDGN